MTILTEKEYSYGSCKGTNSTNHFTKQHSQRGRCLFSSQRKLQRHPSELDATLRYEKNRKGELLTDNKRNGHSSKTLKNQFGEFQIDVPRDRNGEFKPKLIPKYQRDISGIEVSVEMVSKITDKILPQVKEWQSRPLHPIYPFVFMDCIHYKVREDGRILNRAANVILGITTKGYKDILSITVGANETSKFWLGMLNDLKNRGFMLRNSFKYINYNDLIKFSADFKAVYHAPTESTALTELDLIKEKWGKTILMPLATGKM